VRFKLRASQYYRLLTKITAYRNDPRQQAVDHANLAAEVDRLYIREWDQE
jgi:mitogen-activated protein kinase kinase